MKPRKMSTAPHDGTIILGWFPSMNEWHSMLWEKMPQYEDEPAWCIDHERVPVEQVYGGQPTFWLRLPPPDDATPSQRLDAATVERCAQAAENAAYDCGDPNGERISNICCAAHGCDIAAAIRDLTTEPYHEEKRP